MVIPLFPFALPILLSIRLLSCLIVNPGDGVTLWEQSWTTLVSRDSGTQGLSIMLCWRIWKQCNQEDFVCRSLLIEYCRTSMLSLLYHPYSFSSHALCRRASPNKSSWDAAWLAGYVGCNCNERVHSARSIHKWPFVVAAIIYSFSSVGSAGGTTTISGTNFGGLGECGGQVALDNSSFTKVTH